MCSILVHSETTCVFASSNRSEDKQSRNHKYLTYRGHGLFGTHGILGNLFCSQKKRLFRSNRPSPWSRDIFIAFFSILNCIVSFRFFLETIINSDAKRLFAVQKKRKIARGIDDASKNTQSSVVVSSAAMRRN